MHGTILIVDDQEIGRITLEGLLLPLGHDLHFAASGREALALLDSVRPDVVLLDVMMPEMDGFAVCREIRATPRWRDVPVLMVTALDDRDSRIRGLEAGADDFLSKPVDRTELRARVQTTISLGRTRRQLQERAKFEWVVTQSSDGFLWLDDNGVCQYANPAARRWLELDAATPPPDSWLEHAARIFVVQPPLSWPALRAAGLPFELTLVRPETPQAAAFWLQVAGSPLAAEGADADWMVHLKDVTTLQQQTQRALTMLDLASHKLRTPLALIQGPLEMLQESIAGDESPDPALWRDMLDILMGGVKRLSRDTEQLLDLADRLEEPQASSEPRRLDATQVAEAVQRVCQDLDLPAGRCALRNTVTRLLPLSPMTLELILRQLLENARKFHPQQTPRVQITVHDDEAGGVRLEVEDDGPGIPPELQEQVWQPFYQIDRLRSGQVPGMGLGLSLVANYVWAAGGRCWIERAAGGGARVCLALPAAGSDQG